MRTARLTTAVNAELAIKTWESESAEQRSLDGEELAHICLGIARLRMNEVSRPSRPRSTTTDIEGSLLKAGVSARLHVRHREA